MSRTSRLIWLATAALVASTGCQKTSPSPKAPQAQANMPGSSSESSGEVPSQIGGEPVVKLTRNQTPNGNKPEFLTATVLPGRGMNLFQITANVPGKGIVDVLASPSLEEAASTLTGSGKDDYGNASFSFGGAFLVPYPNRIFGEVSSDKKTITTEWHGHKIVVPANWGNSEHPDQDKEAMHGLILDSKTEDVKTENTADGQTLTGTIRAGDFGGHWLSKTDLNFTIALTGKYVDAMITATNVGKEDEPIAIGWHPYFAIPSGDRAQARLHVPAEDYAVVNNYQVEKPTGQLKPVKGTKYDFDAPDGKPLDDIYLDDNWSHLKRTDGNVDVNLTDPESHYGVRILGMSPEIKTVQVYSPPTKKFAAIEEQFNFADPFGKEWHGIDTGMVDLKPGKSVTWHVRLELFTPGQ